MAEQAGSEPGSGTVGDPGGVDGVMEDLAADTRAAVRRHPRPGQAVRQVVLRVHRARGGTQLEVAVLEPTAHFGSPATTRTRTCRPHSAPDHVL